MLSSSLIGGYKGTEERVNQLLLSESVMCGLTITLPREAVLFSIKSVITRAGAAQPASECIKTEGSEVQKRLCEAPNTVLLLDFAICHVTRLSESRVVGRLW